MKENEFIQRDADGRLFKIEVFGPGERVKITDIMSPTGNFWWELPERVGVNHLRPVTNGDRNS